MNDQPKFPVRNNVAIPPEMLEVWQHLLNLIADVFRVPAALIMRVHAQEIEVFLRSTNPENIYERGEMARLDTGLYCETVMGTRRALVVPNALTDPSWDHNPDVQLGMIAYLGFPLLWPTGHVFGTICALDSKENPFSEHYLRILEQFKTVVEHDLKLLDVDLRLRESEVRYRAMFNSVLDGIYVARQDGRIVDANEMAQQQLGRAEAELKQLSISDILHAGADWSTEILPSVQSRGMFRCEGEQIRKDGVRVPVDLQFVHMTLGEEPFVLTVAHDITTRKTLEVELSRLATTDALTGTGNRAAFERALELEITHADRYKRPFSLMMMDIDYFKSVNDRFGHDAGDRVLRQFCATAARMLRESDQFFRFGGEEFVVLMPETDLAGALHVAERVRQAVEMESMEHVGAVTVSIGVTQYSRRESRSDLVNRADSALYAAKSTGRNRVCAAPGNEAQGKR